MKKLAIFMLVAAAGVAALLIYQGRGPELPVQTTEQSPGASMGQAPQAQNALYSGKVTETMDAGGYTYVCIDTGTEKVWAAGPTTTIEVGTEVSIPLGMLMSNFTSESLDRTFEEIYFVNEIATGGSMSMSSEMPAGHPNIGASDAADGMDFSGIQTPAGGTDIATLFSQKSDLAGKQVIVCGKVVKFTGGVLGKNWIHIRDGSGGADHNDLTITTDAVAQIGDVVTATGSLSLDKDFGYGYKYEILIEDAKVTVEIDS